MQPDEGKGPIVMDASKLVPANPKLQVCTGAQLAEQYFICMAWHVHASQVTAQPDDEGNEPPGFRRVWCVRVANFMCAARHPACAVGALHGPCCRTVCNVILAVCSEYVVRTTGGHPDPDAFHLTSNAIVVCVLVQAVPHMMHPPFSVLSAGGHPGPDAPLVPQRARHPAQSVLPLQAEPDLHLGRPGGCRCCILSGCDNVCEGKGDA